MLTEAAEFRSCWLAVELALTRVRLLRRGRLGSGGDDASFGISVFLSTDTACSTFLSVVVDATGLMGAADVSIFSARLHGGISVRGYVNTHTYISYTSKQ